MARAQLCLDALIRPEQIEVIETLLGRRPDLKLVINHGANPPIGSDLTAWATDIRRLASNSNAYGKLSGLLTTARGRASRADLRRVFDVLLDAFGPKRLMWGSDWPVLNLTGSYEDWFGLSCELLADLTKTQQQWIMSKRATDFYLSPRRRITAP